MSSIRIGIIGAGAAGSAIALWLAREGLEPFVFERDSFAGEHIACGGAVVKTYFEALELPLELADRAIKQLRIYHRDCIKEWEFTEPLLYSFQRSVVDRFVMEQAQKAGARFFPLTAARSFECEKKLLFTQHLQTREIAAHEIDLLIVAAGAHYSISGIPCGLTADAPRCYAAYVELDGELESPDSMEFYLDPLGGKPGYFWVFPKKQSLNVGVGWSHIHGSDGLRHTVSKFVKEHSHLAGRRILRHHGGVLPIKRAKTVTGNRVMVIGDAAGMVNPFTGGGLLFAQKSARLAANAIINGMLKRCAVETILENYKQYITHSLHWRWLQMLDVPYSALTKLALRGHESAFPWAMRLYCEAFASLGQVAVEYRKRFPGTTRKPLHT